MEIFKKKITVSAIKLILLIISAIILILSYFIWNTDSITHAKISSILSGLLTGFIIGFFQLLLSWFEHKKIKKFEDMQILDVMTHRDDRNFYEKLIKESKKEISVMGVTASRFIEHFADLKSDREECKVLLNAMTRKVTVKLLLPNPDYLIGDEKQIAENKIKTALLDLKKQYDNNFEFKYFKHTPAHSIFIVDDKCILGPVFPKVSSRDTPAIYLESNSPFAQKYLDYFHSEWEDAEK